MQTKQAAMLLKNAFDAFARKNFSEREAFSAKKRIDNFPKTTTVTAWEIWY